MRIPERLYTEPYLIAALWCLAAVVSFWSFGYGRMSVDDLWWHLANGRWIWEHRSVPLTDPFSFTAYGHRWINDAWLSDLIYYVWAKTTGLYSLVWWKWTILVSTFLFLMLTLRRTTGDWLSSYFASIFALIVAAPFLDLRPQLYSFLGFVVILYCALDRRKPLLLLPLLFLIWANLHALAYFGLIALAVIMAPLFVNADSGERRRIGLLWLGCMLVFCITPNGASSILRPLHYALSGTLYSQVINEWLPPFYPGGVKSPLYPFAIVLFGISVLIIMVRNIREKSYLKQSSHIALGAITLVMSLRSRRFIPLFAISESLIIAPQLALISSWLPLRRTIVAPVLAIVFGIILIAPFPINSYAFQYLTGESTFPVETCNFIETNKLSGDIFAQYDAASYVMFRTNGKMKVYIDGRADMVYPDEVFRRYLMVAWQKGDWVRVIEQSGADYVLWPTRSPDDMVVLKMLIQTGRWRLLYEDFVSALLVRSDKPGLDNLVSTPESPWRELAEGASLFHNSEFAASESHFKKALEMAPYSEYPCYALAASQSKQGKSEESRKTMSYCYKKYPSAERDIPFGHTLALPAISKIKTL